jgi:antitoxin MazE
MRTHVIPIGNSMGIRIPRAVLDLCHIHNAVNLEVQGQAIVIRPIKQRPRAGWEAAFKKMHRLGEDQLLIDGRLDLDFAGWEW